LNKLFAVFLYIIYTNQRDQLQCMRVLYARIRTDAADGSVALIARSALTKIATVKIRTVSVSNAWIGTAHALTLVYIYTSQQQLPLQQQQ